MSNIYVIKDPGNPDNEGKVFLYSYGKKIFDKLNDLMRPQFEDETPVNPFDFWGGANFKLKYRTVDGYGNYDKSEFDSPSPLSDDDSKMESIYKQCHSLEEFVAPSAFKTYDQLKDRLDKVLGVTSPVGTAETRDMYEDNSSSQESMFTKPTFKESPTPELKSVSNDDDDDDSISYFERLANES
jgi:hypothetical protein